MSHVALNIDSRDPKEEHSAGELLQGHFNQEYRNDQPFKKSFKVVADSSSDSSSDDDQEVYPDQIAAAIPMNLVFNAKDDENESFNSGEHYNRERHFGGGGDDVRSYNFDLNLLVNDDDTSSASSSE